MKKNLVITLTLLSMAAAGLSGAALLGKNAVVAHATAGTNTTNAVYVSQVSGWTKGNRHSGLKFTLDAGSKVTPTEDTAIVIDYENLATTDTYLSFYLNDMATNNRINSTSQTPNGQLFLYNDATHVKTYSVSTGTADIYIKNSSIGTYNKMVIKLSHFNNIYQEGVETSLNNLFFGPRLNICDTDRTKSDIKGFVKGMYVVEFAGEGHDLDMSSAVRIYTPAAGTFTQLSGVNDATAKYLALKGEYVTPATVDVEGDANGSLALAGGAYIGHGTDLLIQPNTGYNLSTLTVNGVDVTDQVSNGKYHIDEFTNSTFVARATFATYSAKQYAQDFISLTDPICATAGYENLTALKAVWPELESKYNLLTATEKTAFADPATTDADIQSAVARYQYICGKYNAGSIQLNEFVSDVTVAHSSSFNLFFNMNESSNYIILISMIAFISILSVGAILVIRKRKHQR